MTATLCLHAGARQVTPDELDAVPCPPPSRLSETSRVVWHPVPHGDVLRTAVNALGEAGYEVERTDLGLSKCNAKFFGTLTLKSKLADGVSLAVGIRSSIDKTIGLQWCAGNRVFVCDNLAFSSEKVISRKHTTNGITRYKEAIQHAVSDLRSFQEGETRRIELMQRTPLSPLEADGYLLRLYDAGVLSVRLLPDAIKEWREPTYPEFAPRTLWSLFNAATTVMGGRIGHQPQKHAALTIRLGSVLCDGPQFANAT